MQIKFNIMQLHDGIVKEYHLEQYKNPNGPEMRSLRGPEMSMVFQDPMTSLDRR